MEVEDFRALQAEQCERAKGLLWTTWVPKSAEVFRRLPPICINGDADAYYRSITTLQSNQLRGLIRDSLSVFTSFFAQHQPVSQIDPQGDTLLWAVSPAFNLDLLVAEEGGRQVIRPGFAEVADMVQGVLDAFITAVEGIPRLGSNVSGGFTTTARGKQSTIPCVGLDEEEVVAARRGVLDVIEGSSEAVSKLMALFDDYMYLISVDKGVVVADFCGAEPPPDLEAFEAEIDRYHTAARDVRLMCTNVVRTGLYSVRTGRFKEQLATEAEAIASMLLDQIRVSVRQSNERIIQDYIQMEHELGKTSNTGAEVLALKKYIQKCTVDTEKLKDEIAMNKQKEDFMFGCRCGDLSQNT
jgi:dynein heavy chain